MKDLKIGITINLKDINDPIWLSEVGFVTFSLYRLLKKNYNVTLLNLTDINLNNNSKYLKDFKFELFNEKYFDMDLIIVVDGNIDYETAILFKDIKSTNKIVAYKFKNDLISTNEDILYRENIPSLYKYEDYFDEIWYTPKQFETNKNFYATLYKTDVIIVPFIWEKESLDILLNDIDLLYDSKTNKQITHPAFYIPKDKKRIGIIEGNVSMTNTAVIPLMITEESYRTNLGKTLIENTIIDSSHRIKGNKRFISIFRTFDLFNDGKISFEHMYNLYFFVTQFSDVIVSHQLLNPLNYLYMDLVYMGYPVLHNSYMCKELGYYYEGSNIKEGSNKLNWILANHDKNINEYKDRNNDILYRYYIDNPIILDSYNNLINNLFNNKNKNSELVFDVINNKYI